MKITRVHENSEKARHRKSVCECMRGCTFVKQVSDFTGAATNHVAIGKFIEQTWSGTLFPQVCPLSSPSFTADPLCARFDVGTPGPGLAFFDKIGNWDVE